MELGHLPSVDALAEELSSVSQLPDVVMRQVARNAIDAARDMIRDGQDADPYTIALADIDNIAASVPTSVINATGVLLHTNLGRAQLHQSTAQHSAGFASGASNVEIDLRTGKRAKRLTYLRTLLPLVTGAHDGIAVNNNAGALLLSLAATAGGGGKVAVSRGELIEIGGSFRLPDLMSASGAKLVEVGTTNRTRLSDYEKVAGTVDAILKVHPSNYRVEGFSEEATYAELATLAKSHSIPFIADVGSGLIDEAAPWLRDADRGWLRGEPGVRQTVASGPDLVLFSGDKLLGGPQAGIIVGTSAAIDLVSTHPIARAVRLDGSTIAAICDTLTMYADQRVLDIPFWTMASATIESLNKRSTAMLEGTTGARIVDGESLPGAGTVPGRTIPTRLIELPGSPDVTWATLASHTPPIIATRRDDSTFIDLRTVQTRDDDHVAAALQSILN